MGCLAGFVLGLIPGIARAVDLSAEERAYVRSHPSVTMCVDPDWRPFEWVDERGMHRGIGADLVRLVASRVGFTLELVRTRDWGESLAASRAGRCAILSFVNQTSPSDSWLDFTAPVFVDPNVFITREDHGFVANLADFAGQTIVFPVGTAMEEVVRRDYPGLKVLTVETEEAALAMVASGKADMTMRSLIVAAHAIKTQGLFNLKIAGKFANSANRLRIGVARDDTVLRDILDKGVLSIGRAETEEIVNRYVPIKVETGVDQMLILKLLAGFFVIAVVGGVYHVRLRRLHAELKRVSRTDPLTGLANRATIDSAFAVELERNRRHERPLSILMVDIDHFKSINDRFGHQAGDRVLKTVAAAIRAGVRLSDTVGRWGGEEFLVLCPETGTTDARALADRLRLAVRAATADADGGHSISVGIAGARADDTTDALLRRADAALYRAKSDGRDCVRLGVDT